MGTLHALAVRPYLQECGYRPELMEEDYPLPDPGSGIPLAAELSAASGKPVNPGDVPSDTTSGR